MFVSDCFTVHDATMSNYKASKTISNQLVSSVVISTIAIGAGSEGFRLIKSATAVSPTTRQRCDVSSQLFSPDAISHGDVAGQSLHASAYYREYSQDVI